MQKENRMGVAPVPGLIVTMAVPIMISMVVQSMYNIVDSIFVARISEGALTAASLAYSAQMLQIAVAVGTGVGANALVSRRLGAKQQDAANEAAAAELNREYVLAQIRREIGVTQTDMADRLGVAQPTYATQERNDNMRIGTLRRIVGALGGVLKMQVEIDCRDYPLGFSATHAAMART